MLLCTIGALSVLFCSSFLYICVYVTVLFIKEEESRSATYRLYACHHCCDADQMHA